MRTSPVYVRFVRCYSVKNFEHAQNLERTFGDGVPLRKLAHAIYRDFLALKNENFQLKIFDIVLIFAQNIDCLAKAVLTSTHNLCFGAKIRKIGILLRTPVLLYKSGI